MTDETGFWLLTQAEWSIRVVQVTQPPPVVAAVHIEIFTKGISTIYLSICKVNTCGGGGRGRQVEDRFPYFHYVANALPCLTHPLALLNENEGNKEKEKKILRFRRLFK